MHLHRLQYEEVGGYLGAAHRNCNSSRQCARSISVHVHNLSGFDGCFLVSAFVRHSARLKWSLSGLPKNSERFMGLNFGPYAFRDSCLMLQGSLAALVEQAVSAGYHFPLIEQFRFGNLDGKRHRNLLMGKGHFPYDAAITAEQLESVSEFPDIDTFYSMLTGKSINQVEYDHAKRVFEVSGCRHLRDYCEL